MLRMRCVASTIGVLIAALPLAACAGPGSGVAPEASAEAVVTGEAVALDTEQAALCEQIVAQGLPADAAAALAEASGYTYVVVESGQDAGAAPGTVVFTSADGIVVDCAVA